MTKTHKKKENAQIKVQKIANELKTIIDRVPQFIGFKARHRYCASNNAGQTVFGEMKYLFDRDLKEIVASYDMDDDEYKAVRLLYQHMRGEDVVGSQKFDSGELMDE